ncbi:hypothetical protein [Nocardia sp. NRRL S-836]|uniref:hypothetical protein n=1 Tax=Nocardia sp. NRRL S-836 TaxID=1519492 RepID=UPI0006B003FC|nr:hypothetical protein [Nocardia sp. NRRL S-836]KOV80132.1 hypothetical protein ADL03_34865 [Nocardia sp. NRRL S-836]
MSRHLSSVDGDNPGKPCLVLSDGEWQHGTLTWEPAKRADGLWWAAVTYLRDGQLVTEVRSQHDVRAQ